MANGDSSLSTRMPAEEQNTNYSVKEAASQLFKKHKVDISCNIEKSFPFLELLRDHGYITNKKYKDSNKFFKQCSDVSKVVYDILSELEDTFDLPLLNLLFSKFIMKMNPKLKNTCEIFKNEIPNIKNFLESFAEGNEEIPGIKLQLEQGPGQNSDPSLPWRGQHSLTYDGAFLVTGTVSPENGASGQLSETEEINAMDTSTTRDNNNALESQQANEQCPQESKPAVIKSEDSTKRRNREELPEASTSALTREPGTMDPANNTALDKVKKKRRVRKQRSISVNYKAEILSVNCGEIMGMLIKRKLERGSTVKCIRSQDGYWFTPREFEIRGGYKSANNWKTSLTCGGKTLKELMEKDLPKPPRTYSRGKKEENSYKCCICQDGGKLFRCESCSKFFHEKGHLPPVETKRNGWNCTFCAIQKLPRGQQPYRESEELKKQMGPEEKLKCEYLMLMLYKHLEGIIFPKIPHEQYEMEASRCLEKLRMLDKVKNTLIEGGYTNVKDFVKAMNNFFQESQCNDSDLTKEEFTANFKELFANQETI